MASSVAEERDESDLADYEAMRLDDVRKSTIMFGIGSSDFSEETMSKHFADVPIRCFHGQANTSGRLLVT